MDNKNQYPFSKGIYIIGAPSFKLYYRYECPCTVRDLKNVLLILSYTLADSDNDLLSGGGYGGDWGQVDDPERNISWRYPWCQKRL